MTLPILNIQNRWRVRIRKNWLSNIGWMLLILTPGVGILPIALIITIFMQFRGNLISALNSIFFDLEPRTNEGMAGDSSVRLASETVSASQYFSILGLAVICFLLILFMFKFSNRKFARKYERIAIISLIAGLVMTLSTMWHFIFLLNMSSKYFLLIWIFTALACIFKIERVTS